MVVDAIAQDFVVDDLADDRPRDGPVVAQGGAAQAVVISLVGESDRGPVTSSACPHVDLGLLCGVQKCTDCNVLSASQSSPQANPRTRYFF